MPGPPHRAGEHVGTTANIYAEHHKLVFASTRGKAKADRIETLFPPLLRKAAVPMILDQSQSFSQEMGTQQGNVWFLSFPQQ